MSIKAVLFDLDGTLLPMDQDVFIKAYFSGLVKKLVSFGYDPEKLTNSIWLGSMAMVKNDGLRTNEEVFWESVAKTYGKDVRSDEPKFNDYYVQGFDSVKRVCGYNPKAPEAVKKVKALGLSVVLATNPVFPAIATEKRASWAGLDLSDFELYTTFENSRFSKPNTKYYLDILDFLGIRADEALMVGNDVSDDMVAKKIGLNVFLLTDNLINKSGEDVEQFPHGGFDELISYIELLTAV